MIEGLLIWDLENPIDLVFTLRSGFKFAKVGFKWEMTRGNKIKMRDAGFSRSWIILYWRASKNLGFELLLRQRTTRSRNGFEEDFKP